MTITYGIMFVMALLLLFLYLILVEKKAPWLILLFVFITITNLGYLLISLSRSLDFAIFSNKIAYLGSVFLMFFLFMNISDLCKIKYPKGFVVALVSIGVIMYLIICTTGYLPWYYTDISLEIVDGVTIMKKSYGPLHIVYSIYIAVYFLLMIIIITSSFIRSKENINKNALLMALIVLGNITVWFVEKFVPSDFEFLSISYLMSEVFLLFLYWIMEDYVHKDHIEVRKEIKIINAKEIPLEEKKMILSKKVSSFSSLSDRETSIIDLILENKKRKEIASILNLSENTIKTYTRSIFAKLGVSSREDIFDMIYEDHDKDNCMALKEEIG